MSIINKTGFFRMLYIGHTSPLLNILHLHTYTIIIISIFLVQHVLVTTGNVLLVWSRRLETTVSRCLDFAMAFEIVQATLQMKRTSAQQVNICYAPDNGCIDLQDTYHQYALLYLLDCTGGGAGGPVTLPILATPEQEQCIGEQIAARADTGVLGACGSLDNLTTVSVFVLGSLIGVCGIGGAIGPGVMAFLACMCCI